MIKFLKKLFGIAEQFERNTLNEVEVMIHKQARHGMIHGYMVATNRVLGIKLAPVAFVFPDFVEPPLLTHRLVTDLWEAFHSQGWVPDHIASYGSLQNMQHGAVEAEAGEAGYTHASAHFDLPLRDLDTLLARRTKVPAVQRQEADSAITLTRKLGLIHDEYAERLHAMPADKRDALEIQIDQIIQNGLALKTYNLVIERVRDTYDMAFNGYVGDHVGSASIIGESVLRFERSPHTTTSH
jgi:hypothetical protein